MEDTIPTFYCCIILHNIAVQGRVDAGSEGRESELLYDCVAAENIVTAQSRVERLVHELVQRDEADVEQRTLEVEFLAGLGINVLDDTLAADAARIEVLPILERAAQVRWQHLYDVVSHKKLTKDIMRDLKQQYKDFKNIKLLNEVWV